MDLQSGALYWPGTDAEPQVAEPLDADVVCDALVVGSGITGALSADALVARGVDVIVIDRRALSSGSTPASTALVQYEADRLLIEISELLGVDHARAAYRACRGTLDDMVALVGGLRDSCDLRHRRSLYLASRRSDVGELIREVEARGEAGINADWLDAGELRRRFGVRRPGAIITDLALEINPVKLTRALLVRARTRGARLYERSELDFAGLTGPPFTVLTAGGAAIRCGHVVIAVGYEAPEQFSRISALTELRSTYVVTTAPTRSPPWPESVLIWERDDPYFYARGVPDGRVIIGGEDNGRVDALARDRLIARTASRLMAKIGRLFPELKAEPEFAWAGTFAQTEDGLPYIGGDDCWPNIHFALGYGGNGLTFSLLAAQIIADRITGRENPHSHLFSFDRPTKERSRGAGSTVSVGNV